MKKRFELFAITFLFVLLLLCGCAPESEPVADSLPEESSQSQSEESSQSQYEYETANSDYYKSLIFAENGKYGIRNEDGDDLVPAEYDGIEYDYSYTTGFYVLTKINDGVESYEIVLPSGEFVTFCPVDGYCVNGYQWNLKVALLQTTESGTRRTYLIDEENETQNVIEVEARFPYLDPKPRNGWFFLRTYSKGYRANYGIVDSAGNVVIEPIYIYAKIPFADRFILCEGDYMQSPECFVSNLTDSSGKLLNNNFNYIDYTVFDDGSYIGVAYSGGEIAEVTCYTDGEPTPRGFWFIDKDGKILSERFKIIDVYTDENYETKKDYPVTLKLDDEITEYSVEEILNMYYQ